MTSLDFGKLGGAKLSTNKPPVSKLSQCQIQPHLSGKTTEAKRGEASHQPPNPATHVVCGGVHTQTRGPHGKCQEGCFP